MAIEFCNSSAICFHYGNNIFQKSIHESKILNFIYDLLIATTIVEENLEILKIVLKLTVKICGCYYLLDKCTFLKTYISTFLKVF